MRVGVRDIFGIDHVSIDIVGLDDRIVYTNNDDNVTLEFEWHLSGRDEYKRAFCDGFKINISAVDRNGNLGFRNEKLDSIKDIVVSAFLGPLLAIAKFIIELASGVFSWIANLIKSLFDAVLSGAKQVLDDFTSYIMKPFKELAERIINIESASEIPLIIIQFILKFMLQIFSTPVLPIISLLFLIPPVIEVIVNGVSMGASAVVSLAVGVIVPIVLSIVGNCIGGELGEAIDLMGSGDFIGIALFMISKLLPTDNENSKGELLEDLSLVSSGIGIIAGIVLGFILAYLDHYSTIDEKGKQLSKQITEKQSTLKFITELGLGESDYAIHLIGDIFLLKAQLRVHAGTMKAQEKLPYGKIVLLILSALMGVISLSFTFNDRIADDDIKNNPSYIITNIAQTIFGWVSAIISFIVGLKDIIVNKFLRLPTTTSGSYKGIEYGLFFIGSLDLLIQILGLVF